MRLKPIGPEVLEHFRYVEDSPSGLNVQGSVLANGYRQVVFNKQFYKAHRIVWALHHGDPGRSLIDHINGDKGDNRVANLRLADHAGQQQNRPRQGNNKTGVKGLSWSARRGQWVGQVQAGGKSFWYASKDRGVVEQWLKETRARWHGEFAKH